MISTFEGHQGDMISLVAREGGRLASGSDDGMIKIWNVATEHAWRRLGRM